jgi:hypothetical protein
LVNSITPHFDAVYAARLGNAVGFALYGESNNSGAA